MSSNSKPTRLPAHLSTLFTLARQLQRLDNGAVRIDAELYRRAVDRVADELASMDAEPPLLALLDAFPAASLVYENLHYEAAGLCRSPRLPARAAAAMAVAAIERAKRR